MICLSSLSHCTSAGEVKQVLYTRIGLSLIHISVYSNLFSPESIEELTAALQTQFLSAIWETFYVTLLSTAFAIVIGLPLGVLLVAGERDGVLPLPRWLMSVLNVLINLLRSIPVSYTHLDVYKRQSL